MLPGREPGPPSINRTALKIICIFLIGIVGGGVQLVSLGTAAINRPIMPAPGDSDDGENDGIGRGNRRTLRKPPQCRFVHHKSHMLPGREPGPPSINRTALKIICNVNFFWVHSYVNLNITMRYRNPVLMSVAHHRQNPIESI
jgi:hypothetical protein